LMAVPTHLHMERTLDWVPASLSVVGWGLIALLGLGMAAAFRRGEHRIALGLAWFVATWFPISGLIPLNAPMAEHWLYVPMAGLLWALFEALHRATPQPGQRMAVGILAAVATVVFIGMSLERNRDWRDNETLFRATLRENPRSLRVHYNLAVTFESQVDKPIAAIRHFERVVELYDEQKERAGNPALLWPEELDAHLSLGDLYLEAGRINMAVQHFAAAARGAGDPAFAAITATASYGLGRCMLEMGDSISAVQQFQQALRIRPELGPSVRNLLAGRLPGVYS
jgi:tetratricopeptide (TPR) repeat protein